MRSRTAGVRLRPWAAKAETASILEDLADDFASYASLISRSLCHGEPDPEWAATWLEYCGYASVGEHLLTRMSSLTVSPPHSVHRGRPTVTQIHERLSEPRWIRSLELMRSPRRTDSHEWTQIARALAALGAAGIHQHPRRNPKGSGRAGWRRAPQRPGRGDRRPFQCRRQ